MAGQNPALIVRVAANLAELKANLAEGKSQIETTTAAMGKLAASFSGDKLIQAAMNVTAAVEKIGGASQLTEAEMARVNRTLEAALEKYRVLGKEAPAGMQQLADATKGATAAGEGWSSWLGKASGLLAAFGIGVSVSALVSFAKGIVDSAGALVDLHEKTGASLEQLQRWNFVGGQAGVTTEDFATASFKLGVALAGGSKSVKAAVEDLGLSYARLKSQSPDEQFNATVAALEKMESPQERNRIALELFGKSFAAIAPAVAKGYTEMAAQAQVSSDAQILAIDAASDAWDRFVANQKSKVVSWLGNAVLAQEQLGKLTAEQLKQYQALTAAADFAGANKFLLDLAKQVDIALPPTKQLADETEHLEKNTKKAAAGAKELTAEEKALAAAATAAADAIKAHWNDVGTIVDRAFGVDTLKAATNWEDAVTALGGSLSQFTSKDLAELETAMLAAVDTMARNGTLTDEASSRYMALATQAHTLAAAMGPATKAVTDHSDALYDLAVAQDKEYAAQLKANDATAKVPVVAQQAIQSIMAIGTAISFTVEQAHQWNALMAEGMNVGNAASTTPFFAGTVANAATTSKWVADTLRGMPGRASGGPVSAGTPYMVGERGPELFTPSRGGSISPNGGGGSNVIHIYITQPLGTPAAIAAAVDHALIERQRDIGTRL